MINSILAGLETKAYVQVTLKLFDMDLKTSLTCHVNCMRDMLEETGN